MRTMKSSERKVQSSKTENDGRNEELRKQAEIRQRQASMLNAMLCCLI